MKYYLKTFCLMVYIVQNEMKKLSYEQMNKFAELVYEKSYKRSMVLIH